MVINDKTGKKLRNGSPAKLSYFLEKVINITFVITPNWFLSYFLPLYKVVLFPQLYLSRNTHLITTGKELIYFFSYGSILAMVVKLQLTVCDLALWGIFSTNVEP